MASHKGAANSDPKYGIDQLQPPPWPLVPLNAEERRARLSFMLDTQDYGVAQARSPMTKHGCDELLVEFKDPASIHILEPDVVAKSRDDNAVPDDLIRHCPAVEIDRVWHSHEKGPLSKGVDLTFDALPLDKKDQAADYYIRKTGPIEFYDVSRFFNERRTWASFAEVGELVCNDPADEICRGQEGYELSSTLIIGPVLDRETCEQHLLSKVKAGGRFRVGSSQPYAFRETPAFYAYAEIKGDLYRIGLSSSVPWGQFSRLLREGSTSLVVEPASAHKGGLCVYETQAK